MSESNGWGKIGLGVLSAAATDAPREAGVYFFLDEGNNLLYVGKAVNLRQRSASTPRPRILNIGCSRNTTWFAGSSGSVQRTRRPRSGAKQI